MSSDSGTVDLNAATVESSDEAHRVPLDDETVATPHNLTLYYASDTCKKISDFFPKEKICKHEGETVCIERSEAADILLNAGTMPRSFIELWSSSERGHGPKWFIKNKHASKKVEICHGGRPALLIQNQVAEVRNGCEIRLEKQGPQKLTFLVRIEDGDTLTGDFKVEVLPQEQMPLPGYGFNRQVSLASSSGHSDSSGSSGSDGQFSGMPNMFTPPTVTDLVTALVGLSLHTQLGSVRPQQCQYCHGPHNVCSHNTCMNCISHHSCGQASGLPPAMSVPRPCGGCGGGAAGGHQTPVPHAPPTAGSETTPQSAVQAVLSQNRFQPSLPPGIPVCDGTLPVSILHQNGGSIGPTELSSHAAHAASLNHTQYFQQPQQHHQLLSHGNEMHSSSQVSQVAGPLHGPLSMPVNNSYTNSVNNNSAYPVLPESSFYPSP